MSAETSVNYDIAISHIKNQMNSIPHKNHTTKEIYEMYLETGDGALLSYLKKQRGMMRYRRNKRGLKVNQSLLNKLNKLPNKRVKITGVSIQSGMNALNQYKKSHTMINRRRVFHVLQMMRDKLKKLKSLESQLNNRSLRIMGRPSSKPRSNKYVNKFINFSELNKITTK